MTSEPKNYTIYDLKKDQLVARISPEGVVYSQGNPEAEAVLKALMQREIVIQEHQKSSSKSIKSTMILRLQTKTIIPTLKKACAISM